MTSKTVLDAFNRQGAQEASAGKCDGPGMSATDEEQRAYWDGYYNTRGQIDAGADTHDSPDTMSNRLFGPRSDAILDADGAAYEAGWQAARTEKDNDSGK